MTITHGADETPFDDHLTVEERYALIEIELSEIKETLAFIKEHIVKSADTIDKVSKEVMPTLNQVMESPMLRMLTGGKKK